MHGEGGTEFGAVRGDGVEGAGAASGEDEGGGAGDGIGVGYRGADAAAGSKDADDQVGCEVNGGRVRVGRGVCMLGRGEGQRRVVCHYVSYVLTGD